MKRRQFIKNATIAGTAISLTANTATAQKPVINKRMLNRDFIRVGMVGLGPYSQTMTFTQAINEPSILPRTTMKVVAVWGKEDRYLSSFKGSDEFKKKRVDSLASYQSTDKLTKDLGVENVVKRPEDMVKLIDAVFIMDPEDSLNLARPFLATGMPVFINRPIAWTMRDVREIVRLAGESGSTLITGSHIPWMNEFQVFKSNVDSQNIQHYYSDCSTVKYCSDMPHIFETAQMLVGRKVIQCSTQGVTWPADEDPLDIPPVMTHLVYEKTPEDRYPILGAASSWYGQPWRNWIKIHFNKDVKEQGVYLEGSASSIDINEHLLMPFLHVIARTFETGISPEDSDYIIQKVATMLMAHKSGAEGGRLVGVSEIENHTLPRYETEKA